MERRSVEVIVRALNAAGVRYLVVGGLAVVAHGFVRFTAGIDLVLDPEPGALRRAIDALSGLGYRPRAPVEFAEFADPEKRERWAREKGLTVFSVFSAEHPATEIDLFVGVPFDFERACARRAIRGGARPRRHLRRPRRPHRDEAQGGTSPGSPGCGGPRIAAESGRRRQ